MPKFTIRTISTHPMPDRDHVTVAEVMRALSPMDPTAEVYIETEEGNYSIESIQELLVTELPLEETPLVCFHGV